MPACCLFAMAMESMAARIRAAPSVEGIRVGVITHKISLYADDTLLFLKKISSLSLALHIVHVFGSFSGIGVNWGKSLLFSLHASGHHPPTGTPLNWTSEFKYLGVLIRAPLSSYIELNLMPLLKTFSQKCMAWRSLPLSPVGRVNLVKMIYLPKFLYFFRNSPLVPPASFFAKLKGIITSFVWNGRPSHLAISTLQFPIAQGGPIPTRLSGVFLGGSCGNSQVVVLSGKRQPSGNPRSGDYGIILLPQQSGVQWTEISPRPHRTHAYNNLGIAQGWNAKWFPRDILPSPPPLE